MNATNANATQVEVAQVATLNVAGFSLRIKLGYAAGIQVELSASEATELNRIKYESVKRRLLDYVKRTPSVTREELQAKADELRLESVEPAGARRRAWSPPPDPTQLLAEEIARGHVRTAMSRKGESEATIGKERFKELVLELSRNELILAEARRRMLANQCMVAEALGETGDALGWTDALAGAPA